MIAAKSEILRREVGKEESHSISPLRESFPLQMAQRDGKGACDSGGLY